MADAEQILMECLDVTEKLLEREEEIVQIEFDRQIAQLIAARDSTKAEVAGKRAGIRADIKTIRDVIPTLKSVPEFMLQPMLDGIRSKKFDVFNRVEIPSTVAKFNNFKFVRGWKFLCMQHETDVASTKIETTFRASSVIADYQGKNLMVSSGGIAKFDISTGEYTELMQRCSVRHNEWNNVILLAQFSPTLFIVTKFFTTPGVYVIDTATAKITASPFRDDNAFSVAVKKRDSPPPVFVGVVSVEPPVVIIREDTIYYKAEIADGEFKNIVKIADKKDGIACFVRDRVLFSWNEDSWSLPVPFPAEFKGAVAMNMLPDEFHFIVRSQNKAWICNLSGKIKCRLGQVYSNHRLAVIDAGIVTLDDSAMRLFS